MTINQRKKVSFSTVTKVKFISRLSNSVDGEISRIWYDANDFFLMRRDVKMCSFRFRLGLRDCDNYCERGLEKLKSIEILERCKINNDCVISGVLKEQKRQKSRSINSPNAIAETSQFWSRRTVIEGQKLAESDEIFASSIR